MKHHNDCRFCNILNGEKYYGKIDRPFIETDNFFAISTIGALVEGWVLIIPKKHEYSMQTHYSNDELLNLVYNIERKLYNRYKKSVILFEHGANACGSLTSCGTDHAHLHLVPLGDTLLDAMQKDMAWELCDIRSINNVVNSQEYLFYCEFPAGNSKIMDGYINILNEPISQYFRKLIAEKVGIPEQYNYKEFPNIEIALKTHNTLSQAV